MLSSKQSQIHDPNADLADRLRRGLVEVSGGRAIDPAWAAGRILSARKGRVGFLDFCRAMSPGYSWDSPHLLKLSGVLERVERGEVSHLVISMPRRHGKSTLCSQFFPVWSLGRNPGRELILASYASGLAEFQSRKARAIAAQPFSSEIFPGVFPGDLGRQSVAEWSTVHGGGVKAVGVGGGITGRGGDLIVLDDPYSGRAEADSQTTREAVLHWYESTLYPCREPGAAVILIMTRWRPDDLAGELIRRGVTGEGSRFEELVLAPDEETKTALWAARYPWVALEQIRANITAHEWSAQYLQRPVMRGGNMLQAGNVVWENGERAIWPEGPWFRVWDLASTEAERASADPDYTAGAQVCVTRLDSGAPVLWARDWHVGRWSAPERQRRIKAVADRDGLGVTVGVESVAGYKDAYTLLREELHGLARVVPIKVSTDKVVRAGPLEVLFETGHVHIEDGPHREMIHSQIMEFPRGGHDDCVDVLSHGYRLAGGPGDADRVFEPSSVDSVSRFELYSPSFNSHHAFAIAYSSASESYALLAAKEGETTTVYAEVELVGGFVDHARQIDAAYMGRIPKGARDRWAASSLSVMDGSEERVIASVYSESGIPCGRGWDETQGYASLTSALGDKTLKIAAQCPMTQMALRQFQTAPETVSAQVTGGRQRFVWAGRAGLVRALFDMAVLAREMRATSEPVQLTPAQEMAARVAGLFGGKEKQDVDQVAFGNV